MRPRITCNLELTRITQTLKYVLVLVFNQQLINSRIEATMKLHPARNELVLHVNNILCRKRFEIVQVVAADDVKMKEAE